MPQHRLLVSLLPVLLSRLLTNAPLSLGTSSPHPEDWSNQIDTRSGSDTDLDAYLASPRRVHAFISAHGSLLPETTAFADGFAFTVPDQAAVLDFVRAGQAMTAAGGDEMYARTWETVLIPAGTSRTSHVYLPKWQGDLPSRETLSDLADELATRHFEDRASDEVMKQVFGEAGLKKQLTYLGGEVSAVWGEQEQRQRKEVLELLENHGQGGFVPETSTSFRGFIDDLAAEDAYLSGGGESRRSGGDSHYRGEVRLAGEAIPNLQLSFADSDGGKTLRNRRQARQMISDIRNRMERVAQARAQGTSEGLQRYQEEMKVLQELSKTLFYGVVLYAEGDSHTTHFSFQEVLRPRVMAWFRGEQTKMKNLRLDDNAVELKALVEFFMSGAVRSLFCTHTSALPVFLLSHHNHGAMVHPVLVFCQGTSHVVGYYSVCVKESIMG